MTRTRLREPAQMITTAAVRGTSLFLPDWVNGLREVDLDSGVTLRRIPLTRPGGAAVEAPTLIAFANDGFAASSLSGHTWYVFDRDWRFVRRLPHHMADPHSPALLDRQQGRLVVFGYAREELTGTRPAWLFLHTFEGAVVPLAEYTEEPLPTHVARFQFEGFVAGGVEAIPEGGWLAVDPVAYRVLVFDRDGRLIRSWRGANPAFRAPNLEACPPTHGPDQQAAFLDWQLAQVQVKRPVMLADGLVAIVLGLPADAAAQRHQLDLYRLDGTPLAVGLDLPGLRAGRSIVAVGEPGRLVLVTQERSRPMGSPTSIWRVKVSQDDVAGEAVRLDQEATQ